MKTPSSSPRLGPSLLVPLALAAFGCAPGAPEASPVARPRPPIPSPAIANPAPELRIRLIGGPTAVLDLDGTRFLTDPTFSDPGEYPVAPGRSLTKTEGPAVTAEALGPIDVVLLSHDQHVDNLDPAGRAFVARAPVTFTTPLAAERLAGHLVGLTAWQSVPYHAPNGRPFRITAVPAHHGPDDTEAITGPVTGFVVASEGLPSVYVSGDNASVDVVRQLGARERIDVAVLFAGAAKSPKLLGDALLTLDGELATEAARLLPDATIVPVHFRGWKHFTEGEDALRAAFDRTGMSARLRLLGPGQQSVLVLPTRGAGRP